MSLPKKKRGFRKIVVDGKEFNWRFNSEIVVCPVFYQTNKLIIDFGWFDSWLYLNDKSATPPDYNPKIVTPSFVRKAIEFALKNNWNITGKGVVTKVVYRDDQFNIILPS